jgi:hypothetical protein
VEERSEEIKKAAQEMISQSGSHACRNDPNGICPVTLAVSEDAIFVEKPSGRHCVHYIPFGNGGFCDFSPRKKLYNTYGI